MKNNKQITNPTKGMRIKMALPTSWCQVKSNSPYIWFKGKIIEVSNSGKSIVVSIKSKECGRIDRMMCFKENGVYKKIIKQK